MIFTGQTARLLIVGVWAPRKTQEGKEAHGVFVDSTLVGSLVAVRFFVQAAPQPGPSHSNSAPPTGPTEPTFTMGPVEGLTTVWHTAPAVTSMPLGTVVQFQQDAPPSATVTWLVYIWEGVRG